VIRADKWRNGSLATSVLSDKSNGIATGKADRTMDPQRPCSSMDPVTAPCPKPFGLWCAQRLLRCIKSSSCREGLRVGCRHLSPVARRSAYGASRPLRRILTIVSFPNPQPALSLVGGSRSSCPTADFRVATNRGSGRDGHIPRSQFHHRQRGTAVWPIGIT
jgi:hypothetical protein